MLLLSSGILAVPFNITLIQCNLHVIFFVISFIAWQMQSDLKTISTEIFINNLTTLHVNYVQ